MFQHVQTEIEKKKKKKRPTDPKYWSMLCQYKNFFRPETWFLNLDSPVILFTLTFNIILPFDNSNLKKKKKKKKKGVTQPTDRYAIWKLIHV